MVVGHWVDHSSRKGLNGFHIAGFAHGFGDRVDSGRAINLGNDMTSLNRGSLLDGDGDINTMFGFDFSAGSLNCIPDSLGNGKPNRSSMRIVAKASSKVECGFAICVLEVRISSLGEKEGHCLI